MIRPYRVYIFFYLLDTAVAVYAEENLQKYFLRHWDHLDGSPPFIFSTGAKRDIRFISSDRFYELFSIVFVIEFKKPSLLRFCPRQPLGSFFL